MSGNQAFIHNSRSDIMAVAGNGFGLPRLSTSQRLALTLLSTDSGVTVMDTDSQMLMTWMGSGWNSCGAINNAKSFGVVGDGVTDDTVAAQNAINAGPVFFPAGTYLISTLQLPSDSMVIGAGTGKTIFFSTAGGSNPIFRNVVGTTGATSRVVLRDFQIMGNGIVPGVATGGIGLQLESFQNSEFRNLKIAECRNTGGTAKGIYLYNNTGASCYFNRFYNIWIGDCDDAITIDNLGGIYSCGYHSFFGTTIYIQNNCVKLLRTASSGAVYCNFYDLQIQGDGTADPTHKMLYIESSGNQINGIQIDNPGAAQILTFQNTTTSGNYLRFISGFNSAKYTNNQTSGAANTVDAGGVAAWSPGKGYYFGDPIADNFISLQSTGANAASEIYFGNSTGSQRWKVTMSGTSAANWQVTNAVYGTLMGFNSTGNGWLLGPITNGVGGGVGVINMANCTTAPTSDPTGGGLLYVKSGTLSFRPTLNAPCFNFGYSNTQSGAYNGISGFGNSVNQDGCYVFGNNNTINTGYSQYVLGTSNTVTNFQTGTMGYNNQTTQFAGYSFGNNIINGGQVTVCFGSSRETNNYAFVSGNAIGSRYGERLHGTSGNFAAAGDKQYGDASAAITTADATPTVMYLDGPTTNSNRLTIGANRTIGFTVRIIAATNTAGAQAARFHRQGILWRGATAATTAVYGINTIGTDSGTNAGSPPAGWSVAITADTTNGALTITVTGAAATSIRWSAVITFEEQANQ